MRQHGAVAECIGQWVAACAIGHGDGPCIANASTSASISSVLWNNRTLLIVTIVGQRWYCAPPNT